MIRHFSMLTLSTLATLATIGLSASAAAQTTVTFSGTIDQVGPEIGWRPAWRCVRTGDPFTVTYTFDETAAPTTIFDPSRHRFEDIALAVTVQIGEASSTVFDGSKITTYSDWDTGGPCIDGYSFEATNTQGFGEYEYMAIDIAEWGPDVMSCPTAVASPALPTSLDLAQFTETRSFALTDGSSFIMGTLTAVKVEQFNDDCANAAVLPANFAVTPYYAVGATTDGLDAGTNCDYGAFGDEQNYNDVWFTYTPSTGGVTYISTLDSAGYDTRLTVYNGYFCPDSPLDIIACNDDETGSSPFEAGLDVNFIAGTTYTIRLGTFNSSTPAGTGMLQIAQGPGSGGILPAPEPCTVRRIPLNYNFNGIVHDGEAGAPDALNGFRSISDRALDFQAGVPSDPVLDPFDLVSKKFRNDIVHLGNRNTVTGGLWAFDATVDMDDIGVQPNWLGTVDQTANQSTTWFVPIALGANCEVRLLLQGTDGGTAVDVDLHFASGISFNYAVAAGDWFGGPYPGTMNTDSADPGPPLNITADTMPIPMAGENLIGVTFTNTGVMFDPMAGSAAILAMNVYTGDPTPPANDDCANAIALPSSFADTVYNPLHATTDGSDAAGFCDYGLYGDEINHQDVWFTYTPDVGGCTYISTLGLAGFNTRLTVYDSTACPDDPANIIACADWELHPIASPYEAGLDVVLTQGQTYLIRVGTQANWWTLASPTLRIAAGPGAAVNSGGTNPGAPGCDNFLSLCNGDDGDQMGCIRCPCGNSTPIGAVGGCINSAGNSARLLASGDKSVSLPSGSTTDLRFGLSGAPPSAFCILNSGDAVAPQGMSNPCFGLNTGAQSSSFDGLRCAVQNTLRHGGRAADSNGDVGLTNNPWGGEGGPPVGLAAAGAGFVSGQTRYFQVINRDDPLAVCGRGLNTSQAVRVTFTP